MPLVTTPSDRSWIHPWNIYKQTSIVPTTTALQYALCRCTDRSLIFRLICWTQRKYISHLRLCVCIYIGLCGYVLFNVCLKHLSGGSRGSSFGSFEPPRGGHRNVPYTSICDGDQSEIKGSSTLTSVNQRIKIEFRPKIRSKSEISYRLV